MERKTKLSLFFKRGTCASLAAFMLLMASGCNGDTPDPVTDAPVTDAPVTTVDPNAPDPAYPSTDYNVISKEDYLSRTTAGFVAQLVGMVSGYEFATYSNGRCRVAMPDGWFDFCNGPYAGNATFMKHADKLRKNQPKEEAPATEAPAEETPATEEQQ